MKDKVFLCLDSFVAVLSFGLWMKSYDAGAFIFFLLFALAFLGRIEK